MTSKKNILVILTDRYLNESNGYAIDLVLIDPQSVRKRTHNLMDTVNAKKRWNTVYWRVNKYLK
jgi:hypothetical protein